MKNNVKTAVLLAAMGALIMGIGSFFGQGGLIIGLLFALVFVGGRTGSATRSPSKRREPSR